MATLEDIMKKHNIPVKQKPQPTNAGFKLLDQASLKQPVPKYVPEKKTKSFSEFAAQGNPGWEALAAPGYGAYRLGQLLPESVRKWGTRAGETGGEIMTLSHLPKKTSTESKAGDVTADLFGNVMGFVTNPRGGVQSLGAGLWRGTEGAVGALLPKIAPKITQASPVVQTGIRSGLTSVPWEATYAGVNDRPMSAGEMGLAVGANVGLDMLTHGLARGVGRKAPAPAERSASYDYLLDGPPQVVKPDFTVDPLGNATKGRPLQALPSGTKPLALPPGRQPLALPGGEPKMLNAGQNWEFGTGYPKEGYWFADPFGVVRGTPETALALPEGLPTSPEVRFGDPRGQVHYPSSEFTRNAQHVKALEGKYKKIVNDEIASMKDEVEGVIRYRPGEGAPLLRASMNPKWYRDFWASNGRAPRAGEMRDMAIERLIRGNPETGEPPSEEFLGILSELSRGRKMPEEWHGLTRSMREMEATGEPELRPLIGEMSRRRAGLEPSGLNRNLGKLTDMENSIRRRTRMADEADFGQYGDVRFKRTQDQDLTILRDAMGEKEFVDTFGQKWTAAKAKGGRIEPASTDTPEFRNWFGDSKVVDERGNPLVVYHGTNKDFSVFSGESAGDKTGNPTAGWGFFFTHRPAEASSYATDWTKEGGNVMPVYVSVKNPYIMPYSEYRQFTHLDNLSEGQAGLNRLADLAQQRKKELIEQGYDGIYVMQGDYNGKHITDSVGEIVAFEPTQIKSVYNRGTWDATNPDIRYKQNQDLAILQEAMTKRVGPLRIGKVDLAPEAFQKPDFKAAQTIADKLGLRLVAFKGTGHRGMQQGRTIYINKDMKDPLDYVFWHEVGHTMEVTHPQHYDSLMGIALEHMQDADGLLKHYKEFGYAMEDMPHEFAADVFAEALHTPGFFARVAEKSPEMLKPLLEAIDSLIANIKAMVSKDDTVLPYLKDLETLRTRIHKEVAEPYFKDAMGEKEFVDTFGKQWTDSAAKAKGGRIEPTPIDTPVFRRWFEGSKVVDEQGRPLVVYHNTSADFNAFDVSKARQSQDIPGIFFSDSPTEWADMGDRQIQAYLSIKNPYTGDYTTYKGIRGGSTDTAFREIRDALIKDGYDGIITRDGDTTEYIAFFPEQIKSIYNRGTWNPTNPDIRYKLNQTSPLDDLKSMVEYGAANLRGGRASFEKAIRQQFGKQLEGYSPETVNLLLNDIWHDARDLQQKGKTVLKFQGQEIPLRRGETSTQTATAETPIVREGSLLEGLDINPSELRDISGRQAGWRDIWRNMRDTFGDKFPEIEKRILYPLEDAKAAWVDHQRALTDDLYTNVVDELGIKKGSRESELVQLYGEGGYRHWESAPKSEQSRQRWLANLERKYGRQNVEFTGDGAYVNESFDYNDLVNEVGAERAADIVQAENWFRQKYDELLDQVNTVREQLYPGQQDKLVPKRQDYFHHFREMEGVEGVMNLFDTSAQISPELAGKSMYTRPKTKFAGFMQQRGMGKYKPDAVGGFLEYVPSATYAIHIDPQGAAFRQLENELVKTMDGNTGINKFLEYLKYYADDIQGKTNFFDRNWQFLTSRELFQGLVALNNRIKGNMVLGNAGTMVSQVFNMPQGIAFAKQYSAPGLTRYLSSLIKRMADPEGFAATNPMAESRFLKERFSGDMYRRFATKPGEKAKNVAVIGMEDVDRFATEFIWSAAYEKALHTKGITDPVRYADYHARRLVAGRGVGEVPLMQKSKIVQLVAPFQVEVGNLLNVIGDMRVDKDWIGAFVALPLTLWLFNRGSEAVKGMPVALDPIEAVREAIQIALDDTKDDKALRIFGRLAGEFLGNVPLGQTVAALYPEYGFKVGDKQLPTRKEFFGREDPTRYGSGLLIAKAIQDPLYKAVFPWGGAQAKKTVQGIDALRKGGSYTNKDQLRYPISTDPVNALKGVVFGPSGFRETDPYYEADRRPLSEKQTEKVQKSRSPKEAYEGIHRTRKINALKQQIKDIAEDKKLSPEEKKKKTAILKLELQRVKAGY